MEINYLSQLRRALDDYRGKYSFNYNLSETTLFKLLSDGYQDGKCSLPPFDKVFPDGQVPEEIEKGLVCLVARELCFSEKEKKQFKKIFQEKRQKKT